ncbi:hypothetical protein BS50DRAFT_628815 [Corynespora cassiicola Philippines]|uniref:Mid2 domain-containing protein n=1 Tax=Corynespora cassiicola Philippines TaxID=1448308 RepID=A0A2T2PDC1_CORCC|nr:hypothetical protein BS50DRAFT_628815 [Corynespora cassiicola Philippines]
MISFWQTIVVGFIPFNIIVVAQTSSASFGYPRPETNESPRIKINVFDTIEVEWESNFDHARLYLWCKSNEVATASWFDQLVNMTGNISYSPAEQSDINRDWSEPWNCHFDLLYIEAPNNRGYQGPPIYITSSKTDVFTKFARDNTRAVMLSEITVSTSAPSSISSQVSPTVAATFSPSPEPSETPTGNSESDVLTSGAKAGIVVGATLGAVAIGGLGYLFYRNRRKLKELESRIVQSGPQDGMGYKPVYAEYAHQGMHTQLNVPPQELETHRTHELPASN